MDRRNSYAYWMVRQQIFFIKQKLFFGVSSILLDNSVSSRLRGRILKLFGANIHSSAIVRGDLVVLETFNITCGSNVYIGRGCTIDASGPVILENDVVMAYGVTIVTGSHHIGETSRRAGATRPEPVRVGRGCWIGAGATILPGVSIGQGAVVGAASVVTRDVPPDTVVAGNPARPIRLLGE